MAGYEGVAIVRTVDSQQGLVALLVTPAFYMTVLDIIGALSQEMPLCLLTPEVGDTPESALPGVEHIGIGSRAREIDIERGGCYKSVI
jgi:hypothetical protein